jgi:mRNA-degrading endonuclease RelE of RelBE toxin-antitoxin system
VLRLLEKQSVDVFQVQRQPVEKEGYRKAVIKNYILLYKVDETAKTVSVLRFFYGARDYMKLV